MPNGWKITIHGGFAWVFREPPGNGGRATRVTVGPYEKPGGHPDFHPHAMILRVPRRNLNAARTNLDPWKQDGDFVWYELRGRVRLNAPGAGEIERTVSDNPRGPDDFYYVYDADRFRDRQGRRRTPLGSWQDRLTAQLELTDGRLEVLPQHFVFEISDGTNTWDQPLASHIDYHPRWDTPREVEFRVRDRTVVATPADFDISAECGCPDVQPEGPIAGFDVTFDLYQDPQAAPRFRPRLKNPGPPASAFTPGPDCPPRSYSF